MEKIDLKEISNLSKKNRINFINSLSGFKSANLIGTRSATGLENLAIMSSVTHVGSTPPLLSIIFRPPVVERHSYENILKTKYFTINHVDESFFDKAHQTSKNYHRAKSEFTECDIEKIYLNNFYAPFVKKSKIKIALKLKEYYEIKINKCVFVIGEIKFVYYDKQLSLNDGSLNLSKAGIVSISGLDTYHNCTKIKKILYKK